MRRRRPLAYRYTWNRLLSKQTRLRRLGRGENDAGGGVKIRGARRKSISWRCGGAARQRLAASQEIWRGCQKYRLALQTRHAIFRENQAALAVSIISGPMAYGGIHPIGGLSWRI